jgi:hypothetical protein
MRNFCTYLGWGPGTKLPTQSVKEKFKTAALESFDYSPFIFSGTRPASVKLAMSIRIFTKAPPDTAGTIGTRSQTKRAKLSQFFGGMSDDFPSLLATGSESTLQFTKVRDPKCERRMA